MYLDSNRSRNGSMRKGLVCSAYGTEDVIPGCASYDEIVVPAVERALRILIMLAHARRPLKASEISVRLGFPKTSVHMILRTMERFEFVKRQPPRGSYRLGDGVRRLLEDF